MQPILETRSLTKVFHRGSLLARDRIVAVDSVSFTMRRGEVFTLAGESGCGKSTTARMILGFEQPTAGEIVYGQDEERWHPKVWYTQRIQAVFQNPFETFNPLRKVEGYLFETVHNYKLASSRAEAVELINAKLEAVGLSYGEVQGRYPSEFSGGSSSASPSHGRFGGPIAAHCRRAGLHGGRFHQDVHCEPVPAPQGRAGYGHSLHHPRSGHSLLPGRQDRHHVPGPDHGAGPGAGSVDAPPPSLHPASAGVHPRGGSRKKWRGRITIAETEEEEYLRVGCKFAGRCPKVMEICRRQEPQLVDIEGVQVKCHLYVDKLSVKEVS